VGMGIGMEDENDLGMMKRYNLLSLFCARVLDIDIDIDLAS